MVLDNACKNLFGDQMTMFKENIPTHASGQVPST